MVKIMENPIKMGMIWGWFPPTIFGNIHMAHLEFFEGVFVQTTSHLGIFTFTALNLEGTPNQWSFRPVPLIGGIGTI